MEQDILAEKLTESCILNFENHFKNYLKNAYTELPNIYSDNKKIINEEIDMDEIAVELEEKLKKYFSEEANLENDMNRYEEYVDEIILEVLKENIELIWENKSFDISYNLKDEDDDEY